MPTATEHPLRVISRAELLEASKTEAGKLEVCCRVAAHCADGNPGLSYRYNSAGVYVLYEGKIVLVYSWTITGWFLVCDPTLDVTAYVKADTLKDPRVDEIGSDLPYAGQ